MSAIIRSILFCLGLGICATPLMASTRFGIYAIVDEVKLEPSDYEPQRALISGMFVVPVPISSGLHRPPSRGFLYFSLNQDAPNSTRADWQALQGTAGTGQVVGFGQYWMSCAASRSERLADLSGNSNCSLEVRVHTDPVLAIAEPYPAPSVEGVITEFGDGTCARFGKSSIQIAHDLRSAYSPSIVQDDPPVCPGQIGLISISRLDSAFVTQVRDSEWATATETYLLQRLGEAHGLALSGLGVECRDTICHIRLVFPTREYQESAGNRLAAQALNELPVFAPGGKNIPPRDEPIIDYYFQRRRVSSTGSTQ